jgi:hypothetical protein
MDFLQSLSNVGELQKGISDIRASVALVSKHLSEGVEEEYFQKAQKSQELKRSYFEQSVQIRDYEYARRLIERQKKICELLDKEMLQMAYSEIKLLKEEELLSKDASSQIEKLRDWTIKRVLEFEERTLKLMEAKKQRIVKELEELEQEAGTQVLDEARRYLSFLGRQFMLDSD